jgi:hypothetical protein
LGEISKQRRIGLVAFQAQQNFLVTRDRAAALGRTDKLLIDEQRKKH